MHRCAQLTNIMLYSKVKLYTERLWCVINIRNDNVKKINYSDDVYYKLYIHRLCILLICEYIYLGELRRFHCFKNYAAFTASHC